MLEEIAQESCGCPITGRVVRLERALSNLV